MTDHNTPTAISITERMERISKALQRIEYCKIEIAYRDRDVQRAENALDDAKKAKRDNLEQIREAQATIREMSGMGIEYDPFGE